MRRRPADRALNADRGERRRGERVGFAELLELLIEKALELLLQPRDVSPRVLHDQGHFARALRLTRRALAIFEKVFGPKHQETAQSLDKLAHLLHDQGDNAGSRLLLERALPTFEKVLGPAHPNRREYAKTSRPYARQAVGP